MEMPRRSGWLIPLLLALVASVVPSTATAAEPSGDPTAPRLVAGLEGGSGSTIGPDRALYVTESAAGRITRVDPRTGATTTYASGLPKLIPAVGFGGPVDVAFLGRTAYVLVTLVGPDVGGSDVVGIYGSPATVRSTSCERSATSSPPDWTCGAGPSTWPRPAPSPHLPDDGKVVAFRPTSPTVRDVAAGSRLLVDVEFGRGRRLYALSQGVLPPGAPEGSPAMPNTGALVRVNRDGTFTVVIDRLNQPTSLEFVGKTGYVVTLGGAIWKIKRA
jgi:hypothetical protein